MGNKDNSVKEKVDKTEKDKITEVIQTLKVQLIEHQKQAEHHQTMAVKAQGALEVLLQLHPEEKQEN
tara:strand:- start:47 stop:247 length:201 start_codon:yes stop_codon:yes gene_type:complete